MPRAAAVPAAVAGGRGPGNTEEEGSVVSGGGGRRRGPNFCCRGPGYWVGLDGPSRGRLRDPGPAVGPLQIIAGASCRCVAQNSYVPSGSTASFSGRRGLATHLSSIARGLIINARREKMGSGGTQTFLSAPGRSSEQRPNRSESDHRAHLIHPTSGLT